MGNEPKKHHSSRIRIVAFTSGPRSKSASHLVHMQVHKNKFIGTVDRSDFSLTTQEKTRSKTLCVKSSTPTHLLRFLPQISPNADADTREDASRGRQLSRSKPGRSSIEIFVSLRPMTGDLDACFRDLMVSSGRGKTQAEGVVMAGWKDLPMELLLRIVSLGGDDRTAIVASGVCTGWRDAICLGLTRLSLSWCNNNMNSLVMSLAPKFTKLQVLALRQNISQLEDNAIEVVANYCHDLRDLDLRKSLRITDSSLYALARGCPHLEKLNISGCSTLSDSAVAYLTGCCRNLKHLNLCGCVRTATDRALQAIAYNCRQLQYMNLGWCEGVTDKGVISLALGCSDLRILNLCGCILITDESVIALANGCPHLRSLGLYYCQNITDRAMYSLANRRSKNKHGLWGSAASRSVDDDDGEDGLMSLNISQCTALTPPAVQAVCDSFPALHTCYDRHSLIISGCLSLTSVHCACSHHAHRAVRTVAY